MGGMICRVVSMASSTSPAQRRTYASTASASARSGVGRAGNASEGDEPRDGGWISFVRAGGPAATPGPADDVVETGESLRMGEPAFPVSLSDRRISAADGDGAVGDEALEPAVPVPVAVPVAVAAWDPELCELAFRLARRRFWNWAWAMSCARRAMRILRCPSPAAGSEAASVAIRGMRKGGTPANGFGSRPSAWAREMVAAVRSAHAWIEAGKGGDPEVGGGDAEPGGGDTEDCAAESPP